MRCPIAGQNNLSACWHAGFFMWLSRACGCHVPPATVELNPPPTVSAGGGVF